MRDSYLDLRLKNQIFLDGSWRYSDIFPQNALLEVSIILAGDSQFEMIHGG